MAILDWKQVARQADRELWTQKAGKMGPWRGFVSRVNPYKETVVTIDAGGGSNADVNHPYLSTHSWIRVMPDPNSYVLLSMTSDRGSSVIMNYENPRRSKRIDNYLQEKDTYRLLRSGEIDIQSSGKANIFLSRDGRLNMRGGVVYGHASHPDLEWMFKAPTTTLRGMHHQSSALRDGLWFGAVKRGSPRFKYSRISGEVAKEFSVHLQRGDTPLAEMRMGDVIDKDGVTEIGTQTTNPLRYKLKLMMNQLNSWKQEVDGKGNTSTILPPTADIGVQFVVPAANFRSTALNNDLFSFRNVNAIAGQNATISANHHTRLIAGSDLQMHGPATEIVGTRSLLHPLALGGLTFKVFGFNDIMIGQVLPGLLPITFDVSINAMQSIFIGNPLKKALSQSQPAVLYDDLVEILWDIVSMFDRFAQLTGEHVHAVVGAHTISDPQLIAHYLGHLGPSVVQVKGELVEGKAGSDTVSLTK